MTSETLRKRLYYQSHHRGMKEMDMLLGGFAEQFLSEMDDKELLQFEDFLAFSDQDLYGWLFEGGAAPQAIPPQLAKRMECYIHSESFCR